MQDAGSFSLLKKRVGSKINTSFQKNVCKAPHIRRWKPKPRSHVKTIGSALSTRQASEFSSNGIRNKRRNGKAFRRRTSHKDNDTSSSEKPLSSMFRGIKSLRKKCHGHGKTADRDVGSQKTHRRRKRKKRKSQDLDEAARLKRRTSYLLIKMKLEQNLIDAYSGEGWKGQSREKIRPETELQRAKKQILKCKLGIRDAIRQLESLSSEGCIEDSVIGSDGCVSHEHIFCSKCKLQDEFPDNDIILCDGTCNCAFHQKCLQPPLATENIPPDDQGWYCKFCECKMEILGGVNAHLGTQYSPNSSWQDIFLEAATACDDENATLYPDGDWPSDDSEDVDYDPEHIEKTCSFSGMGSEENVSADTSSSGSLYWTSEEEDGLLSGRSGDRCSDEEFYRGRRKVQDCDIIDGVDTVVSIDSNDSTDRIAYRRRQRRDVDYKKLHEEMFGKDVIGSEEISEDEDWGPGRGKRRKNETNATELVSLGATDNGDSDVTLKEVEKTCPSVPGDKRRLFRIPPDAVKRLREVFAESELPSRLVRENLSKQLGIAIEKINKWFKNARYSALKIRKEERQKHPISSTGTTRHSSSGNAKIQNTNVVSSVVQRSKNLRKVCRRKNSISSKKIQEKISAPSTDINQKLKKAKATRSSKEQELYMTELERICQVEEKIVNLKKTLFSTGYNVKDRSSKKQEEAVVYVPVAEIKEKKL